MRGSAPSRTRPATFTRVWAPSSFVSTAGAAGPLAAVTTRPATVKYGDGGSTTIRAAAPAAGPGMTVTPTTLPSSDAADDAVREAVESFFCS